MKRTTYIIAGILLVGLLAVGSITFYLVTGHISRNDNRVEIGGQQKSIQLPACKTVQLSIKSDQADRNRYVSFNGIYLTVEPADSATGSLTSVDGLDSYMSLEQEGDTLNIVFDFSADKLDEKFRDKRWIGLQTSGIQLRVPQSIEKVSSSLLGVETTFKGFQRDSLCFDVRGVVKVEECHIRSLHAQGSSLFLNSGKVDDLHLNLNLVSECKVNTKSFQIDTEYLSGKRKHQWSLQKDECRQVIWSPLADDATLNLNLKQSAKLQLN